MKALFTSRLIPVLVSILLLISSCQRETDTGGPVIIPPPPPPIVPIDDNIKVTAGVSGIVVDENDIPVQGATITAGTGTTTTDQKGTFRLSNISLSKANGTVKVVSSGFFTGYRSFVTTQGRTHNVRIKLLRKETSGAFSAAVGGTVTIAGGGKITLPANAVVTESGATFNGSIKVDMTWIDPSSPELSDIVMGDLRGITTEGEERGLTTFGMLGVELTGNGAPLKIAPGKKAQLTFPIPSVLLSKAPATIDFWHFDESAARWKQEGTAVKSGSNYVAEVSHFSFWNCDAPFPVVELCMTLTEMQGLPLNNVQVRIRVLSSNAINYGRTDSTGALCGKIPANEPLVLEILNPCSEVVYSQNIGPYTANATLGTIVANVPSSSTVLITGTLTNCGGANVATGAVIVYVSGGNTYTTTVTNGLFSLPILRCAGPVQFSMIGIDYATMQQSIPVSGSISTSTYNAGTVQACGASSSEFVAFMIEGTVAGYASPPDEIISNDSLIGGQNFIWVFLSKSGGGNYSNLRFRTNGAVGLQQITNGSINGGTLGNGVLITSPPVNLMITAIGPPVTGFIEGNFSATANFSGTVKTITCNFRIRRP